LRSDNGDLELNVFRDRSGVFEPILAPLKETQMDEKDTSFIRNDHVHFAPS
jgi:hypothetical protein